MVVMVTHFHCTASPGTQCTNGDLRLSQNFTGRVEFCVGGTYGTVCEKGWDNIEAKVVCTQLGYGTSGEHDTCCTCTFAHVCVYNLHIYVCRCMCMSQTFH